MFSTNNLHDVYLSLGSNVGNKADNVKSALANINKRIGEVVSTSSLFETEPVGFESENLFINVACWVKTKLSALEVLESTQVIERELGRRSKSVNNSYSDRTIDIDILLYDDAIMEYPHLLVPHPRMHERSFVLDPLVEIAPQLVHPSLNKTMSELKAQLVEK